MINKGDQLDLAALEDRTARKKKVISDARHAGSSPKVRNTADSGGITHQTVSHGAIKADKAGAPGGDTDISGGIANLDETAGKAVDQNEYNR